MRKPTRTMAVSWLFPVFLVFLPSMLLFGWALSVGYEIFCIAAGTGILGGILSVVLMYIWNVDLCRFHKPLLLFTIAAAGAETLTLLLADGNLFPVLGILLFSAVYLLLKQKGWKELTVLALSHPLTYAPLLILCVAVLLEEHSRWF